MREDVWRSKSARSSDVLGGASTSSVVRFLGRDLHVREVGKTGKQERKGRCFRCSTVIAATLGRLASSSDSCKTVRSHRNCLPDPESLGLKVSELAVRALPRQRPADHRVPRAPTDTMDAIVRSRIVEKPRAVWIACCSWAVSKRGCDRNSKAQSH